MSDARGGRSVGAYAMLLPMRVMILVCLCMGAVACRGDATGDVSESKPSANGTTQASFEVRVDQEGLIFTYFDADGSHTVQKAMDIPKTSRGLVRVDSLQQDPHKHANPNLVFIADLNAPDAKGNYPTTTITRAELDAHMDRLGGDVDPDVPVTDEELNARADVVIYGASWCGACRSTARFFRSRGVNFIEKDIEKDADAHREMQKKARAAGVKTSGIPVIDFKGTILNGFDERKLTRLVDRARASI